MPASESSEGWAPPVNGETQPGADQPWRGSPPWQHAQWQKSQWQNGQWTGRPPWAYRNGGGQRRHPYGRRWIPVIVAFIVQLPYFLYSLHFNLGWIVTGSLALALLSSFLLLAIRREPGPTVAGMALLATPALALAGGPPLDLVPLAIAVVIAVANGARNWVWPTLAAFAVVGPSLAYVATESSRALVRPLITALFLSLLVGIGEFFRSRRERYREISKQVAARQQTAAEAERVRIARELHDVLAHSLSQISVQAGVGLHLFDTQPERARESLAAIKETSGQALEEVRGVLGFLRSPDEPAARAPEPDLSRLPSLIRSFELSGLPVTLSNSLAPDIPAATQLALFRIVQESLTNAARHAGAAEVTVRLESEGHEYVAIISDNGHGTGSTAEPGRGIVGMRERAELLGGSLTAAPVEGGGFRVEAHLPAHHSASTNGATL